jgi:hypothetical protein
VLDYSVHGPEHDVNGTHVHCDYHTIYVLVFGPAVLTPVMEDARDGDETELDQYLGDKGCLHENVAEILLLLRYVGVGE